MKALAIAATVISAAGTAAAASPLSEALARARPGDIEALRAQQDDPAARCTLGAIYAKRNDLTRAALYLRGCLELELPDDIGIEIRKIARQTKQRLNDSDLAILEIASRPEGLVAETDAVPGESLVTPATLWVKAGTYEIRSTHQGKLYKVSVATRPRARAVAYLDTNVTKSVLVKDKQVDFTDEGAQSQSSGPPPAVKRPSLVPDRYRGKPGGAAGPQIDDPLATGGRAAPRSQRPWSIGARLGGGMFDDGTATARAGLALAAVGRLVIDDRYFLVGRLDGSRRGGDGATVDVGGVSAGAGARLVGPVALLAQLRGDLRLASTRGEGMPVNRAGASLAAGIEVELPSTPLTAGVRFEQGLTEIASGARDRAILVEVGIDWR